MVSAPSTSTEVPLRVFVERPAASECDEIASHSRRVGPLRHPRVLPQVKLGGVVVVKGEASEVGRSCVEAGGSS